MLPLIELQDVDTQLRDINELLGDLPKKVDKLRSQEEELLNDELEMINHSESIFNACADAHNKLYEESGCAVDKIAISIKMIDKIPDPGNVFQKQIQL